jgi:Tfp pilus assembly protein PilF
VCVLALIIVLVGCDMFTGTAERQARAERLLASGDYSAALVELKNVLADQPSDPRALLAVARATLRLGNLEASEKALNDAASAGADRQSIAELRAQLQLRAGKAAAVLAQLEQGPKFEAADTVRVQALGALNRCGEAIPLARTVLESEPTNAQVRLVIAECYGRHGNAARALRELQAAVDAAPADAAAWFALGRVQQVTGRFAEAEKSWDQASMHAPGQMDMPQQVILYSTLADLQIARDEQQALRATYEKLLKLAPQATFTELLGARLQMMEGQLPAAITALQRIAVAAKDVAAVHLLLASAYMSQGNLEQARQEFKLSGESGAGGAGESMVRANIEAAAAAPKDSADYWLHLAVVQMTLAQYDQARNALNQVQAAEPQSKRARIARARLEMKVGNLERARQLAVGLAADAKDDAAAIMLRSDLMIADGDFAQAESLLQTLHRRAPSAKLAIAIYRIRQAGKLAGPAEPLESWLADHPHEAAVRALLAEYLRSTGANDRAIAEYEMLRSVAPDNAAVLNNLAWLYYLEHDARALAQAKHAWQIDPKTPQIVDTYGWLLVESGALEEGLAILEKADTATGLFVPELRYHYVQALLRQGRRDQARERLASLLAEKPEMPRLQDATRLLATLADSSAT